MWSDDHYINFKCCYLLHSQHKYMTLTGNGTFLSPGIIILDWRVLNDPTSKWPICSASRNSKFWYHKMFSTKIFLVPNRRVYTVLGTDYKEWLVGYNCRANKKCREYQLSQSQLILDRNVIEFNTFFFSADVVLQTRSRRPKLKYLKEAYEVMRMNNLPLKDLVCKQGF